MAEHAMSSSTLTAAGDDVPVSATRHPGAVASVSLTSRPAQPEHTTAANIAVTVTDVKMLDVDLINGYQSKRPQVVGSP
jgi:hypothetical protein